MGGYVFRRNCTFEEVVLSTPEYKPNLNCHGLSAQKSEMSMASQRKQAKCNGFWRKRGDAHSCWVQRLNARVLLAQKIELPKGKNRFYQMSRKTGPSIVEQKPAPQMRGSTLENMYLWEVVFWISCSLEKLYSWKRCTFGGLHFEGVVLVHVGSGSNSKLS